MAAKSDKAKSDKTKSANTKSDNTRSDRPPDRLSNDPRSPYYDGDAFKRDVGIRFKGVEKTNVSEYCVSEGWVRVEVGKTKDRYGNPLTIKLTGPVEAYFKDEKK